MTATNIYTDRQHPNYVVRMQDGGYKLATPALTAVYGALTPAIFEHRLRSKAWDGSPTAQEVYGPEAQILLGTLNAALQGRQPCARHN